MMQIYVVREGDNIDKIAAAFGVRAEEIAYDNQILAPYPLAVGQALLIPAKECRAKACGSCQRICLSLYTGSGAVRDIAVSDDALRIFIWLYDEREPGAAPDG